MYNSSQCLPSVSGLVIPPAYHSSEFKNLLETNYPPVPFQTEALLHDRDQLKEQLENPALAPAVKRHLEDILQDYHTALHPMRLAPVEILEQIFLFSTEPDLLGWQSFAYKESCWSLSQVSQLWREIALQLPALWCSVRVLGNNPTKSPTADAARDTKKMELVQLQLQRSSSLPLNVSISGSIEEFPQLLQALLPSSTRWEILSLDIPVMESNHLSPIHSSLPLLQRLYIRIPYSTRHKPQRFWQTPLRTLFESAPKLHTICGDAAPLTYCSKPHNQLISYHEIVPFDNYFKGYEPYSARGFEPTPRYLHSTFQEMFPTLQYCHLKFGHWEAYPPDDAEFALPNLIQLGISGPVNVLNRIIPILSVPQLTHLSVETLQDDLSGSVLRSMTTGNRFSSVRHLALTPGVPASDDLFTFLQTTTNLESFYCEIDRMTFPQQFFWQFASSEFLSRLKTLDLGFHFSTSKKRRKTFNDLIGRLATMRPDLPVRSDVSLTTYYEGQGFIEENGMPYDRWKHL